MKRSCQSCRPCYRNVHSMHKGSLSEQAGVDRMIPASPDFVQSFARGRSFIRSCGPDSPSHSLSEVAIATGLSRATARRFLHTLVDLGYAVTNGTQFQLTPRVLELGTSYYSALTLHAIA